MNLSDIIHIFDTNLIPFWSENIVVGAIVTTRGDMSCVNVKKTKNFILICGHSRCPSFAHSGICYILELL